MTDSGRAKWHVDSQPCVVHDPLALTIRDGGIGRSSGKTACCRDARRSLQPANACLGGLPPNGAFPATQKFLVLGFNAVATVIKKLPLSASINQTACLLLDEQLMISAIKGKK